MTLRSPRVLPLDIEREVLTFTLIGSSAVLVIGSLGPLLLDTPWYPVRFVSFVLFAGGSWIGLLRRRPSAGAMLMFIFTWWWVFPLVEVVTGTDLGYTSRTTMGILLMMLVIILPSVVGRRMRELSWVLALGVGLWGILTGWAAGVGLIDITDQTFSLVLGGLLGNAVVGRYIQRVNRSNDLQRAYAECSHALLTKPDDEAIERALDAVAAFVPSAIAFADLSETVLEAGSGLRLSGETHANEARRSLADRVSGIGHCLAKVKQGSPLRLTAGNGNGCSAVLENEGFDVLLGEPIVVDGDTVGVVGLLAERSAMADESEVVSLLERAADMMGAYLGGVIANRRLQDLVDSKDEFVTSVSHELRTPLAAVVGMSAELAQDQTMTPDMRHELVDIIAEQSREVGDIVDDLLVVARSDIGTLALSRDKLDLRAEVDSVVSALRRSLDSKSVSVTGSGCAWGDPLRVRQIIRNLLSNAARYGGPTIEISVHQDETECYIRVHDDGVGIPEMSVERIFDAYTRAHSSPTQPGSVGIGLAVSRRLARMMGGDVVYDGAASSAFELRLPKAFDFVGS